MLISEYLDKVYACWIGKNIGGTLGGPLEGARGFFDVNYYMHDLSGGVLPNDDLDLQLVWLNAAERYGRNVDAKIMGAYWQTFITAHWSEYGAGKNNMKMGLVPPLSGSYHNLYMDSCGAFIRSEIWACLMPAAPQLAVKYAYEDSIMDHSGEGVYGEIFCAAVESAAFAETDLRELIKIGLSYIPEDCGVAKGIHTAIDCYDSGKDIRDCRRAILQTVPGSFGMQKGYQGRTPEDDIPVGRRGYDAPSNVAIMTAALLYGEGNFDKTVCTAVSCGEDTDCTAATAASIFGLMYGSKAFGEKWTAPIGEEIKTVSVDVTDPYCAKIPKTISELTDRVARLMPTFMRERISYTENGLEIAPDNNLYCTSGWSSATEVKYEFSQILSKQPDTVTYSFPLLDFDVKFHGGAMIRAGEEKVIEISAIKHINRQQWLEMEWLMPDELEVDVKAKSLYCEYVPDEDNYVARVQFKLSAETMSRGSYTPVLKIKSNLTGETMCIPVTLLRE